MFKNSKIALALLSVVSFGGALATPAEDFWKAYAEAAAKDANLDVKKWVEGLGKDDVKKYHGANWAEVAEAAAHSVASAHEDNRGNAQAVASRLLSNAVDAEKALNENWNKNCNGWLNKGWTLARGNAVPVAAGAGLAVASWWAYNQFFAENGDEDMAAPAA